MLIKYKGAEGVTKSFFQGPELPFAHLSFAPGETKDVPADIFRSLSNDPAFEQGVLVGVEAPKDPAKGDDSAAAATEGNKKK